jgi:Grx4 family monothiol glutaredoxin
MDVQKTIQQQVSSNRVVLYMKGTPQFPQCGFSAMAIKVLEACGVDDPFTVNVLEQPEIRQGVKAYSNWPFHSSMSTGNSSAARTSCVRCTSRASSKSCWRAPPRHGEPRKRVNASTGARSTFNLLSMASGSA